MAHLKKISTTLSIATTMLLQACSSGGDSDSAPVPAANTKAPLLIGSWATACITTAAGTSTTTGSSGGGGSISGGEAFIDTVAYSQNGRVRFTTENFSTSNCNTNTLSGVNQFDGVYFIGESTSANDGSDVTTINYSNSSATTYSIFQIVNGSELYLGNETASSTGSNGSSTATRLDGLGPRFVKK